MTAYSPEERRSLAQAVIDGVNEGKSLRKICGQPGTPAISTFMLWVAEDAVLSEQYARAMAQRADLIFDEMLDLADDAADDAVKIQKARLQVDARKWVLGRMNAKKYGDKLELAGDPQRPLGVTAVQYTVVDPQKPEG